MLHLRNLLDEMVTEEETLKEKFVKRIDKYSLECNKLCSELGFPSYEKKKHLTMLQLEKDLRAKVDALSKEKHDRLKSLNHLKEQDQKLCDVMCCTPYYIPSGSIPSSDQLHALEKHVKSLVTEKNKRFSEFVSAKRAIMELLNETGREPESDFERDVVCEDNESFQLSTENMKALKVLKTELEEYKEDLQKEVKDLWVRVTVLWDRLETSEAERDAFKKGKDGIKNDVKQALQEEITKCEQLKFENIQRFVEGMRKEMVEWWDKCFYSKEQRDQFVQYMDENYTETLLEEHEQEVQRLRKYYEEHKDMFENVDRWQTYFTQMKEMEKRANDPNRFNNRGGSLLQEEKARKKLLKDLPKVEEEVKDAITVWEKANERPFLVEGTRFITYIERQWAVYEEQKVKEKEQRHKAKAKQMEEEMTYGSKPTTPARKRFIGTPSKTPSKLRKLNDTTKTPVSCSRMQSSRLHANSVFASPSKLRPPSSTNKLTPANKTTKRRSLRGVRKALTERNSHTNETLFSHTTVSSGNQQTGCVNGVDASLASMETYQEFEVCI
ncbi:hypothetical protein FSP39_000913 [Pinctada imbricata]|uniref:Protein regulator of cytokinesis 1 n=1 Tax=Pinctada imbricata TaxID=66713 RepID=A0AA88XYN5_PINIB|nr:hypothetical protein FSP39_000913 [Pinctada imbricata]